MSHALVAQRQRSDIAALSFAERCGLRVDRELTERDTRRLTTRVRHATLRPTAGIAASDERHPRGLAPALMARRVTGQWVREHPHGLRTAPTGLGHTWLGGALGHQACREGVPARAPAPPMPPSIPSGARRWRLWHTPDHPGPDRLAEPG